ncbi:multisubunit potassium/proton antiporter, PhaE subunit [Pseudidiomarina planktonica]|uniref:Multisubunit potassium/proton antiporter, PhaE subunit n=1 Tax=Pseudidiomarina planktonica TaxID=1323738 RepID=A0A1Y6G3Y4_9GAMM|nr:Na+/H+ antiporter subunit E [Pseudidiomarina planktonica]RUO62848.1 Na+/H+ antiporter subunit E [Pseudidiomarina planktonica]SMQ80731.1 multisubunit potassium/proton antiporter, PhaE subunit [Pseudidiomarina planktonica]
MIKKLLPAPWLALALLIVWLLLQNSITMGLVVLGSILSLAIAWYTSRAREEEVHLHKPFRAIQYFFLLLVDIVVANFKIAGLIIGYKRRLSPALVEFPLELTGQVPITILAGTISLTPGTISSEISRDRKYLLIHALNVDDTDAMIHDIKHRYERRLKEIFGC